MTQIPLFRTTDPSTSRDAAARVPQFQASHEAKIYEVICNKDGGIHGGLTYRQIAWLAAMEHIAVARRLVSMERRKLITRRRHETTGKYLQRDGMALWFRA